MMHLAVYTSNITNGSVLLQVTQLADAILPPLNNGFQVMPDIPNLLMTAGVGTNLTRFQLTSGSIRKMFPWDFEQVNVGTLIGAPARYHDFTLNPIPLDLNEELDAFCVQSNAGAQREYVAVWLSDGPVAQRNGRIQTIHGTLSTTLVANAWTGGTITLDNGLDGGTYAIVGARAFSAGGLFFRFIPRGGGNPKRPGGFMSQARDALPPPGQRYGGWGEWLRFTNIAVPQVEFLSISADRLKKSIST